MKTALVVFPEGWKVSFNALGKDITVIEKDAIGVLRGNGIKVCKSSDHSYSLEIYGRKEKELLDAVFIDNLRKTGLQIEVL